MKMTKKLKTLALAALTLLTPLAARGGDDVRVAENRVVYEVFVRNFSPEGNFSGVEAQIPRLKELGVDVIWLMPIYKLGEEGKWGTYSSPYAVKDFKAIDPDNGDAAQLRSLINTIHANGMEVWFDWVGNHTSVDNVWVSSHPEYYGNNFYHPNGWNDVYQLDFNNTAMHEAMIDAMQYWVTEFGIDGYRCDYAAGPSEEFWSKATSRVLKNGRRIAWLAENDDKPELVSKGYFDYNYAWYFHDRLLDFARGGNVNTLRQECANLHNEEAYKNRSRMVYLSNHDVVQDKGGSEDKIFHKYLKPLTVLEFTVFGMPLIYNGQEIQYKCNQILLSEKTPIDWSNPDTQMTSLIKTLCHLKHTQPALRTGRQNGALTNLETSNSDNIYVFKRTLENENVVVMLNFSDSQQSFTVNGGLPSGTFTDAFSGKSVNFGNPGTFTLGGQGYAVYVSNTSGNIDPVVPVDPHYVYVEDKTGWSNIYIYAYNDATGETAPMGSWPGTQLTGSFSVNGKTYKRAELPEAMQGKQYSFIANDGVGGTEKQVDLPWSEVTGDIYFDNVTIASDPVQTHYVYVEDKTGWSNIYVYAYNDATGETAPMGSWPGTQLTGSYSVNGKTYKRAELPEAMQGKQYSFIANDGVGGTEKQVDLPWSEVTGDIYFDNVTIASDPVQTHYVYVEDKTGWSNIYVYAYNDATGETAPMGSWPGTQLTGSYSVNGKTYKRAELPEAMQGKQYSFIANDGVGGTEKQVDLPWSEVTGDIYFDNVTTSSDPQPAQTHYVYVEDKTGWSNIYVYAYNDATGETAPMGGWPGTQLTGSYSVNGKTYKRAELPEAMQGKQYSFIANDGVGGTEKQVDLPWSEVTGDIYFDNVTTSSDPDPVTPTEYKLYVNNKSGWTPLYVYAWGDAELFGGWPGKQSEGVTSIEGVSYETYTITPGTGVYHLIFNDGNGNQVDGVNLTPDSDKFVVLLSDKTSSFIPDPRTQNYAIYVENRTGWDNLYVYAYSNGSPVLFGAWLGMKSLSETSINGKTYMVYSYTPFDGSFNLIFNNGNGTQYDAASNLSADRDYYFTAEAGGVSGVENVDSDNDVAPVYYNLNGIRVDNPCDGIFIEVRGSQAKKVRL